MSVGSFDSIRATILSEGSDSRVEVNQRALIDKILARYASANAVYRELLQNSNDAEATVSQIQFTTAPTSNGASSVTRVVYKNNGLPFRPHDWSRLRKIAEGNPDVSKVGAFGVGAYTMFSICEEPMVLSGGKALVFEWKADALWVKLAHVKGQQDKWTSFVLPSRDPYPLPDLAEFGGFLCSSLTFTAHLREIDVFVNSVKRLTIRKKNVNAPRIITPPRASSWWRGDGAVLASPQKIFTLDRADGAITETIVEVSAEADGDSSSVRARYVSALANTRVPADMSRHMERVTKKRPPSQVKIEIFVDADSAKSGKKQRGPAAAITDAFSPRMGAGRVFIGFKTSQTTGLAVHLAAPLLPTVEREAIDFQNSTLKVYNSELLAVAGILMRLTLEHSMDLIGEQWVKGESQRIAFEEGERRKAKDTKENERYNGVVSEKSGHEPEPKGESASSSMFNFARFMSSGLKKIADVIPSVDFSRNDDGELLHPIDARPLSEEEKDAVLLMRSFSPQQSTPDERVGMVLAKGFEKCLPGLTPPVLTTSGVARGFDSRLPSRGIETFVKTNVVRSVILKNTESYLRNVAGCQDLTLNDLVTELRKGPVAEDDVVKLLKWWTRFVRRDQHAIASGLSVKQTISFVLRNDTESVGSGGTVSTFWLKDIRYFLDGSMFAKELPMPQSVLPNSLREELPPRVLKDKSLQTWFSPFSIELWLDYIATHSCLTEGRKDENAIRLRVLSTLSQEHARRTGEARSRLEGILAQKLSNKRCVPFESNVTTEKGTGIPGDLYLSSAELAIFDGLGSFNKVSPSLSRAGVSDEFLIVLGVRKTISMDFLFSQLDSLKWNRNPMPLISYLRSVSLTVEDLQKLRTTQYLPEVNDKTRTYAPSELYLPNPELDAFPFVKVLQWPSPDSLHERSADAEFLKKLGCQIDPPLKALMDYLVTDVKDNRSRQRCLEFIYKRLISAGPYSGSYTRFLDTKFLPAVREDPLKPKQIQNELQSPNGCFSNESCRCMGFPILDTTNVKAYGRGYAEVFRCATDPPFDRLVYQMLSIVANAKRCLSDTKSSSDAISGAQVLETCSNIFGYMSTKSMDLSKRAADTLFRAPFIPFAENGSIGWYRPNQIFFENGNRDALGMTSNLFPVTKFSPFLAAVGVKGEPSNEDLFRLLVSSPHVVLQKLGSEAKYRSLLRRIAANPPYTKVNAEMRKSAFLLAYRENEEGRNNLEDADNLLTSKTTYTLAKAEDICVIDNSRFSRLFNALYAPPESDLERFYISIGSTYISKKVDQKFFVIGGQRANTTLTESFRSRIHERRSLLASNIISSPMVPKATLLLSDEKLEIFEVSKVKAIYTLDDDVKTEFVTCSVQNFEGKKLCIFITQNLDWFHVGNAIGSVILARCNVEDAFFIGSLLEAPLNQLRARGFPVDRILRAAEPSAVKPEKLEPQPGKVKSGADPDTPHGSTPTPQSDRDGFVSILRQMFPECREDHIRQLLGPNPSLDSLRSVADQLADGNYPKDLENPLPSPGAQGSRPVTKADGLAPLQSFTPKSKPNPDVTASSPLRNEKRRRRGLRESGAGNAIGRAFRGLRGAVPAEISGVTSLNPNLSTEHRGYRVLKHGESSAHSRPNDAATQKGIEDVLRNSIKSSRTALEDEVFSPQQKLISVPESVERNAASCEVMPAHDLKLFKGRDGTSRTSTGLKVFSSRKHADNDAFLDSNWHIVESFATVLVRLCAVYKLREETVAIFYESTGKTIAFNRNRALFFNLRYFANLHFKEGLPPALQCYTYWFTTIAHELSHNMAPAHGEQHGFYTESYVSHYMPKLLELASPDWRS